jgi:hypothetical protein
MKKSCLTLLSGLAFGGALIVNVPFAWADGEREGASYMRQPADASGRSGMSHRDTYSRSPGNQHWSKDEINNIKQIQEALKEKGFDPGEADGVAGPKTSQAIREFQKSQNLQVTGRIDEKTASALGVDANGMRSSTSPAGSVGNDPSGRQQESGDPSESSTEKTGSRLPTKGLGNGGATR